MRVYDKTGVTSMTIPAGTPVATMNGGQVVLCPGGVPNLPALEMSLQEWLQIRNSVEAAIGVAGLTSDQRSLVGYTAVEGFDGDEN